MSETERNRNPLEGRLVLVVEDEEDARAYLVAILEDAGARTCEARDGFEALELASRDSPDLITLDLSMPRMDGMATFRELRARPKTAEIPVCVVTGHPEYRELIYDRATRPPDGYMNKPIRPDQLLANLRRILHLRSARRR